MNIPEHGRESHDVRMVRNPLEEWPDDAPLGTFDIERHGLQGRPSVVGHILYVCPNGKRCGVFLGNTFEQRPNDKEPNVWGWDGNEQAPTLTPSINCIAEKDGKPTGCCGWHGFIRNGEMI